MSVDLLLNKLDGVRKTGRDRWTAKCPAHEDRRASLSIRELDDGRVLVHDFAGCTIEEILRAVGLEFDALYPERPLDHHKRGERKPHRASDLTKALSFELHVALIILGDVGSGKDILPADRGRARLAWRRITRFLEELQHAA